MNKKFRKLIKDPKAYFYDFFRKQIRNHPKGFVSLAVRIAFANAKTDLGYGKEIRRYLKEGNLDFAERICLEGMSVVPKAIRPYVLYAEISMRRGGEGYFKEVIRRWKTVAEKFPNKPEGYAGEERAYVALGDFEHAEVLCKNSIKNMPQELWPYIELAELSMRQGDFSEALRRWDTVREKFPDKVPGYVRASVACCSLEKFSEAEELCRECMRVAPEDIRSFSEYAEISMRQRDFPTAVERWNTVRETFPREPAGYIRGAYAYCQIKDFSRAEELCRNYMEIAPNNISPFCEYAEISMRKCEYNEASNRWEIVLEKFPDKVNGYIGQVRALIALHEYSKAEDTCEKGLNKSRQNMVERRNLFYCLIDVLQKQHGRAKDCITTISELETTYHGDIKDNRYYSALSKTMFFMLGRDDEEVNSSNSDFILLRLVNEPLDYSTTNLSLCWLIHKLSFGHKDICKIFEEHIQAYINKEHIVNPMATLISSVSSDDDRLNAYLDIIRNNCYHSIQLCCFQPQNIDMLSKACDVIVNDKEWLNLNPEMMFNFARALVFVDQDKGDSLISKIYSLYKDKNLPVSNPIGVLCKRHEERNKLLNSTSRQQPIRKSGNNERLNVAICIGGQLRGYKGNLDSLIKVIGLNDHNYSVFVHTWKNIGRKFPIANPERTFGKGEFSKTWIECFVSKSNLKGYIKEQYPNLYFLLVNSSFTSFKSLREEYGTDFIVIDDEDTEPFSSWDNQEKMHYKIYAAHKLAKDSKKVFDLIIRIRPDLKRECNEPVNLFDIYSQSKANSSILTIGGLVNGYWCMDYLIDDNFAIGIPEAMDVYANTYIDFMKHAGNNTFSRTKVFSGHRTLEHNLFCNGVHVDKIRHEITGSFQDPEQISSKDVYDAICKDVQNREPTSEDQHFLQACKKDMASQE